MSRTIDFGEDQQPNEADGHLLRPPAKRKIRLRDEKQERLIWLVSSPICSVGRGSEHDIVLRVQPTNLDENKRKTFQISALHFELLFSGESVTITDRSSNGVQLKSAGALVRGQPTELRADDEINVAGVLTLTAQVVSRRNPTPIEPDLKQRINSALADPARLSQLLVGAEAPGSIDFVRIRRLNNCPEEEYVLLFGEGLIDSATEALIQLPKKVGTGSRGLDLGGDDAGPVARLFWQNSDLMARVLRNDAVRLNDRELKEGDSVPLRSGDIVQTGTTTIVVEG
jgi:hypothetical protein